MSRSFPSPGREGSKLPVGVCSLQRQQTSLAVCELELHEILAASQHRKNAIGTLCKHSSYCSFSFALRAKFHPVLKQYIQLRLVPPGESYRQRQFATPCPGEGKLLLGRGGDGTVEGRMVFDYGEGTD